MKKIALLLFLFALNAISAIAPVSNGQNINANTFNEVIIQVNELDSSTAVLEAKPASYSKSESDNQNKGVGFKVIRSGLPFPTGTSLIFNAVAWDTEGGYNVSNGKYSVSKAGLYLYTFNLNANHTAGTGAYMNIGIYTNNAIGNNSYLTERAIAGKVSRPLKFNAHYKFNVGDIVDIQISAHNFTGLAAAGDTSHFSCVRMGTL